MKKLKGSSAIALFVIFVSFSITAHGQENYRQVKIGSENLRAVPKGKKIAKLLKSTKMRVIEEKGKWLKVQITGWIWEPSTVPSKHRITEKKIYPRDKYLLEIDKFTAKLSSAVEHIKTIIKSYEFGTVSLSRLYKVMEPYTKLTTPEIFTVSDIKAPYELKKLREYLLCAVSTFDNITIDFNPLNPRYKEKEPKIATIKKHIQQYEKDIARYNIERRRFPLKIEIEDNH